MGEIGIGEIRLCAMLCANLCSYVVFVELYKRIICVIPLPQEMCKNAGKRRIVGKQVLYYVVMSLCEEGCWV